MSIKNSQLSYGVVAKFFHWVLAILIIGMLIFGYFLEDIPKDYSGFAFNLHKQIGLIILILMVLRVLWSAINIKPLLMDIAVWESWAEKTVHYALYIFVIAMPLSGWVGASASGRPPHFGSINIALPITANKALSKAAFELHGTLALFLIGLICIHVLAALFHALVRKDDVFRRMWPG